MTRVVKNAQVSQDDVSAALDTLASAVVSLGDLTKSTPKRKSSGSDPKAKAKASSKRAKK